MCTVIAWGLPGCHRMYSFHILAQSASRCMTPCLSTITSKIYHDINQVFKDPFNNVSFEAAMNEVDAYPVVVNAPQFIICRIIHLHDYDHSFSECKFCNDNKFCCNLTIDTISFSNQGLKKKSDASQRYTQEQHNTTINSLFHISNKLVSRIFRKKKKTRSKFFSIDSLDTKNGNNSIDDDSEDSCVPS